MGRRRRQWPPALVFCKDGCLGYAVPDPAKPDQPWVFHPVSYQDKRYQQFTHGIGLGDINGDERMDIVEAARLVGAAGSPGVEPAVDVPSLLLCRGRRADAGL